jgi:hypothetical protein
MRMDQAGPIARSDREPCHPNRRDAYRKPGRSHRSDSQNVRQPVEYDDTCSQGKELWSLGWEGFPEMMSRFERLRGTIDAAKLLRVIEEIYEDLPQWNFSSHLLQCVPEWLAVMEMTDVHWSNWGNPERILSGLEKFGKQPAVAEDPRPFLYVG